MFQLDFLNKNTLRNYPLRGDAAIVTNEGDPLPTGLIASAQFSSPSSFPFMYVSRIYVSGTYVNILMASTVASVKTYVGFFDGKLDDDYQTLKLASIFPTVYGAMTFGPLSVIRNYQGFHTLTETAGRIEDSLHTYIVPPGLASVSSKGSRLTGTVGLEYNNVRRISDLADLKLEVVNKELVRAKNDTSPLFGNCGTLAISSMNNVTPDEQGNIDIYGIAPLEVTVTPAGIGLSVPSITRAELCAGEKRIPPLTESSIYSRDITTVTFPEWQLWPQYQP